MLTRTPARFAMPPSAALTRAPSARVLVDLSHAADGYVGVAQDLRMIFGMLSGLPGVEVSGLLMPTARHDLPHVHAGRPDVAALTAAVLHTMQRNWSRPEPRPFPLSVLQNVQMLWQILRTRHDLLPLSDGSQLNALWRILFARTLPPEQRAQVLAQQYYATDLSVSGIIDRCAHLPVPALKSLAADGFDAVLFCMPRPVRLPGPRSAPQRPSTGCPGEHRSDTVMRLLHIHRRRLLVTLLQRPREAEENHPGGAREPLRAVDGRARLARTHTQSR